MRRGTTGRLPEPEDEARRVRIGYADAGAFTEHDITRCTHGVPIIFNCDNCDAEMEAEANGIHSATDI